MSVSPFRSFVAEISGLTLPDMEECCVVCAEPLEWVGYGVCGHRDVCSTCIARLRFVLNNKSCCICKQECNSVLMTKALGDFTKVVKDFESLHDHGNLWYESNIHAYFDDKEHFEMVKAMCRLSCQICEEVEAAESGKDFVKKGYVFRSLDLLRRHLLIGHKVQMCSLCLEGRKIFICEQKLYSRVQMDRHLAKGDSEVDGVGEERGGFSGHPMCDFCRSRFYSDNELYHHMSVDHYICHICQRLHPGHYDYFHKYDDLEIHFRHEHALCEHPDCLAKKFVVFISDAELKRHNALMHGGNMSRSQRNAALQIPVSFQYRRPIQGRVSSRNGASYSNGQLSVGAQGSIVSNAVESAAGGSLNFCNGPSSHNTKNNVAESSARGDESSSRSEPSCYLAGAGGTGLPYLEESAFPPLPGSKHARRKAKQQTRGSTVSMAAVLRVCDGGMWPLTSLGQSQVHGRTEGDASRSNASNVAMPNRWSQAPARKTISEEVVTVIRSASAHHGRNLTHTGGERVNASLPVSESSSRGETQNVVVPHLTDAVRIANKALIECIRSKLGNDEKLFTAFKDLSAQFKRGKIDASVYYKHIISLGLWDLVPELARLCPDPEKQRDLLEAYEKGQKDKQSSALKEDSPSMERSAITQSNARRAKDAVKKDAFEQTSMQSAMSATIALRLTDRGGTNGENDDVEVLSKDGYCDLKGKHRAESSSSGSWFSIGSSLVNGAHNPQAKVLVKGTGTVDLPAPICEWIPCWSCNVCTLENSELNSHCAACETSRSDAASSAATVQAQGHGKRKKKTSKFERARLDDGSLVLSLESRGPDPAMCNPAPSSAQRSSGRGAWKNGGGQRLVALAQRDDVIESAWKM